MVEGCCYQVFVLPIFGNMHSLGEWKVTDSKNNAELRHFIGSVETNQSSERDAEKLLLHFIRLIAQVS